jgi:tetratricopeptide (TPR) repeat protein
MRSLMKITPLLFLATFNVACEKNTTPKSSFDAVTMAMDPVANFQNGIVILQSPARDGSVDYATAYTRFDTAAALGAGAAANYNAGWTALKVGDIANAERHLRDTLTANPGHEAATYSLVDILTSQDRLGDAAAIFKIFVEAQPENHIARNDYIRILSTSGDTAGAQAEAEALLRQNPDDISVYQSLSAMYYSMGNYGMSQLCAEKALALDDGNADIYNTMAITYLDQSNEPAAIEKLQMARKLNPNNFEAAMNLGFVALNSGDYVLANGCFESAIKARPSDSDAMLGLAVASRGLKDYDKAQGLYDDILKAHPNHEIAYFNASILNEKYTKDFNKAISYLDAFIESQQGSLSPSHIVFQRKDRVLASKTAEDARKEAQAQARRDEEDRVKRNLQTLKGMVGFVEGLETKMVVASECLGEDSVDEVMMIIEQAKMIIEMGEASMASDIQMMLDTYAPYVDEAYTMCLAYEVAAPPVEEVTDAPTDAPAEATAAEAPAEATAAEAPAEATAAEAPAVEEVTDAPAEATAESESSPETATPVDDATEEVAPAVDEEEPPAAE